MRGRGSRSRLGSGLNAEVPPTNRTECRKPGCQPLPETSKSRGQPAPQSPGGFALQEWVGDWSGRLTLDHALMGSTSPGKPVSPAVGPWHLPMAHLLSGSTGGADSRERGGCPELNTGIKTQSSRPRVQPGTERSPASEAGTAGP